MTLVWGVGINEINGNGGGWVGVGGVGGGVGGTTLYCSTTAPPVCSTVLIIRAPGQLPALPIALQCLVYCVAPRADHLFRIHHVGVCTNLRVPADFGAAPLGNIRALLRAAVRQVLVDGARSAELLLDA